MVYEQGSVPSEARNGTKNGAGVNEIKNARAWRWQPSLYLRSRSEGRGGTECRRWACEEVFLQVTEEASVPLVPR